MNPKVEDLYNKSIIKRLGHSPEFSPDEFIKLVIDELNVVLKPAIAERPQRKHIAQLLKDHFGV